MKERWGIEELEKWEIANEGQIYKDVILDHAMKANIVALDYLVTGDYETYYRYIKGITLILEKYKKIVVCE